MKKTTFTPAIALLGTTLLLGIANAQTTGNMNNDAMTSGTMTTGMMQ